MGVGKPSAGLHRPTWKGAGGKEGRRNMSKPRFELSRTWDEVGIVSRLCPNSSQAVGASSAAELGQAEIGWDHFAY
jgi:hypothetical protein